MSLLTMRSVWCSHKCARAHTHASIPRATVLLENTHLHPSYKVAVVTRAFQPLIDESRPNKRLRRSNPSARFMAPKATRFLRNLRGQNRSALAKRAANGDLAATAVMAATSAKGAPARCDGCNAAVCDSKRERKKS